MASSIKSLEPAFQGVGQKVGTEIWRIENFQPLPLPKSDYGKFYSGDSYIILQTSPGKGGAYLYDIYFWLGKDTSQDEAETAAMKTVELDAILGCRAVQHREIQGHESYKFLSYFKPCIMPLEGGAAPGFKKVEVVEEEEEFEMRLYVCRGKRAARLRQVPFSRSSLNHDDVFILHTKDKIYQFNGANSNIQERAKALEVIQFLKDKFHEGVCDVAIVDDGNLQAETASGEFWVLFGGFAPISKKVTSDDDIIPETADAQLYRIVGDKVESIEGELAKALLEKNKCYVMDCGAEVFVWFGRLTQVDERKSAIKTVEDFIASQNKPRSTLVTHLIEGFETHSFKSKFNSWPSTSAHSADAEGGRGKVAALLKQQQGGDVKGNSKSAPVIEHVPQLLEGAGKSEVWRIDGSSKTPVPHEDVGKFYSGDCYILLYTYHSSERKEDYYLCYWIGNDSIQEDRVTVAALANTMCSSLKGRPVLGRVCQEREPPQFVSIFPAMVVLKGGNCSGYKQYIGDQYLSDETYTTDGVALIRLSSTSPQTERAVQVEAVATSLNSNECFVLQTPSLVFIWHGKKGTPEQQRSATKIAEFLKPGSQIKHNKEGTESSSFWFALGGKLTYTSKKVSLDIVRDPHLFLYSSIKGKFEFEEIYNFSQDDLLTEDIMILDTHAEVFVWVGQSVDAEEKKNSFEIGEKYVETAAVSDGLPYNVPLYKITEGNEPCFFTRYFSWDPAKATTTHGNSFQKKVAQLFGSGHSAVEVMTTTLSSSSGPTQRASALAALNSAFNSSSVRTTTTTSASAKAAGGNSNNNSEGSQRAAAVAALSSVLTAETKMEAANEFECGAVETTYSYEELKSSSSSSSGKPAKGIIDCKRREVVCWFLIVHLLSEWGTISHYVVFCHQAYLCDEEFKLVLGMRREAFYKLPKWKQDVYKKKVDLF
ncbi:hypothetical protein M569_04508 [Genlisea aurea]|uniref:HP domain-containing protein n=1 Tax=Genlisea aurea TaxID=192259 RepID=S8CYY5_9LAMI|nr:hypothetical protein M569_04508 [Genlisea aurea]